MSHVIVFDYRSDNGPELVGPFPELKGAEAHMGDLSRPGFEAEYSICELSSVIASIRAVKS